MRSGLTWATESSASAAFAARATLKPRSARHASIRSRMSGSSSTDRMWALSVMSDIDDLQSVEVVGKFGYRVRCADGVGGIARRFHPRADLRDAVESVA